MTTYTAVSSALSSNPSPPPSPPASDASLTSLFSPSVKLSMFANLSSSYNVISISLVIRLLDFQQAAMSDSSLISSALIFGMIFGQLLFGSLGDILGLRRALTLTLLTQLTGCLLSALLPPSTLLYSRFLLGIGCGGVYPLAASLSSSSSTTATSVVFSMQVRASEARRRGEGDKSLPDKNGGQRTTASEANKPS